MASPITITVQDYSQAVRDADPVTGGVPIPKAWASEQWALFDGATEIPVQTTVLPHRSAPWLLLDFQAGLTLGEKKTFTLKPQAPAAVHPTPLVYADIGDVATVTSGKLRCWVNKATYNLFDGVWWDADGDGDFLAGERLVPFTTDPNLTVRELGVDYSGRGTPTLVEWEYQGPLRGTLRIDGAYLNGAANVISYTTRFTWYAGKSYVRIDHTLRNSLEPQERYVKLTDAKLNVAGPVSWTAIDKAGDLLYVNASAAAVGLDLIPPTFEVTPSPNDYHLNATINTAANSGMIVGDLSHWGATWVLDFEPLVGKTERDRRAAVAADPLVVLCNPDRYADLNAFGTRGMSTYDDEKAAYVKWGWSWPVVGNPWSYEHNTGRQLTLHVGRESINHDWEVDNLWQNVVMFARTSRPFFLDRARAWARNDKCDRAYRTDGFDYAGSWDTEDFSDGPTSVDRWTTAIYPTMTADDTKLVSYNIKPAKPNSTFPHLIGLFDYYYLTGDRDALEAGLDLAEKCEQLTEWRTFPNGGPAGNARAEARQLLGLTCAWEATSDARWKADADHTISLFYSAVGFDPRGFFYGDAQAPYTGGKLIRSFFDADAVAALYRYYLATGVVAALDMVLKIANFGYTSGLDPTVGYTGELIVVDYPTPGAVLHLSRNEYDGGGGNPFSAVSTNNYVNAMVISYRVTGDVLYLDRARLYWERASKRHYVAAYDDLLAGPTELGKFVNSTEGAVLGATFPEQGYLWPVSLLFREAVLAAPALPQHVTRTYGFGPYVIQQMAPTLAASREMWRRFMGQWPVRRK